MKPSHLRHFGWSVSGDPEPMRYHESYEAHRFRVRLRRPGTTKGEVYPSIASRRISSSSQASSAADISASIPASASEALANPAGSRA